MSKYARILVTGGAGFIGSHLCRRFLAEGRQVRVLDNLDPYYDPAIKRRNLEELKATGADRFRLIEGDLCEAESVERAAAEVDAVVHLGALAGVRPSIEAPVRYMRVNVTGTQILLDALRDRPAVPIVFGSSSSVYGGNVKVPFAETDPVDHPVSPYAASKKAGEVVCHAFHHLYGHPITCLRFFTVYGPGQRPEMAIHKFSRHIVGEVPLPFFGDGTSARDYTFVEDIVDGVVAALERADGYRIYNLGGATPVTLRELVEMLEDTLGRKAVLDRLPDQQGDVPRTHADVSRAGHDLDYRPKVELAEGLRRFAAWYSIERDAGRLP
ncbi:MAG: SDR family NAD(P)-dependent oxidoreductase [Planctomycetota bacterium]